MAGNTLITSSFQTKNSTYFFNSSHQVSSIDFSSCSLFYLIENAQEIQSGVSHTLHLTHISAIQIESLSQREAATYQIARLILLQQKIEIQLHEKIAALSFEDIAFRGQSKDTKDSHTTTAIEKRETFSVQALSEEEYQQLHQLFIEQLFGKEFSFHLKDSSKKENRSTLDKPTFFMTCKETILYYFSKRLGQIIQKVQEGNQKLREEESQRTAEDNRKRKIKKRDQEWEQRMDRQLKKEENRWSLLKETMPPRVWNKLSVYKS